MQNFDTEYDLVVVGGGAAGKSAALIGARAGKSVVILEKMPETGGLSVYAEGTAAFESIEQIERGVPSRPDRHFPSKQEGIDKFNSYSHYRADINVVKAFVENSAETIQIYRDLGVEYKDVTIAAYDDPNELWTFHLADGLGAHCQEVLLSAVENAGVDIFVNTPAKELIVENGVVVGVVARDEDGEELRVGGKAVVLASGGMGSSPDAIAKYSWFTPSAYNMNTLTPLQNVGDGLSMALAVGADPVNITTCPLLAAGGRGMAMDSHAGAAGVQPGVWINRTGRRFVSEGIAENIGDIGPVYGKQPGGIVWSLLDQDAIERLCTEGSEISIGEFVVYGRPLARLKAELNQFLEDGENAFQADTIEELAGKIGLEPAALTETVEQYNADCDAGVDSQFGKKAQFMRPLRKAPYYAIALATGTMGSAGGIRVNGKMEVVNTDYEPIPHLYAAGLDVTGLYGDSYNMEIPGASNGFCHTSGRIAARSAIAMMDAE